MGIVQQHLRLCVVAMEGHHHTLFPFAKGNIPH